MTEASATGMPDDVWKTHELLRRELVTLYTNWDNYKALYRENDETVQLLDWFGGYFFTILQEILADDIGLRVCRITDPAASRVRNETKSNLTIAYLVSIIPEADESLRERLVPILDEIKRRSSGFREHRNRRIGHYDLQTRRAETTLPAVTIPNAEETLKSIADCLNAVEKYYDDEEHPYEQGISNGTAEQLLDSIKHYEVLRNKELGLGIPVK